MHSFTVPSTRLVPSWTISVWVAELGWTWVSPDTRRPCITLGASSGVGLGLTSIRQLDEQPSPLTVFPSSHCSPSSTEPLPHTGSVWPVPTQFSVQVPMSVSSPGPLPLPTTSPSPVSGVGGLVDVEGSWTTTGGGGSG